MQAVFASSVELTGVLMAIHGKPPDGGGASGVRGATSCASEGAAKSVRMAFGLFGGFSEAISRCIKASHENTSKVNTNATNRFMQP
ncbi:MAG: hypothetical protein ACRD3J_21945 [Thermoanaerobaculia bacterium]